MKTVNSYSMPSRWMGLMPSFLTCFFPFSSTWVYSILLRMVAMTWHLDWSIVSTSSLCFGVTCRQAAPGVARLVGDVAVDIQQTPLPHPGVRQGIDDDRLVTEVFRGPDGFDVFPGFERRLDAADVVFTQMVVELPGAPFRIDHGDPAAQTEGDEQGRIGLARSGGTGDGQPKLSFFPLCFVKLSTCSFSSFLWKGKESWFFLPLWILPMHRILFPASSFLTFPIH